MRKGLVSSIRIRFILRSTKTVAVGGKLGGERKNYRDTSRSVWPEQNVDNIVRGAAPGREIPNELRQLP